MNEEEKKLVDTLCFYADEITKLREGLEGRNREIAELRNLYWKQRSALYDIKSAFLKLIDGVTL